MSTATATQVVLEIVQGTEKFGEITLTLDAAKAPKTVENFLKYVDAGFFDGTIFHRVMENFMIQGGGHTADFKSKTKGQLAPIQNEAGNGLPNKRGTIAMARTNDPHSATSQFFINVKDNVFLNHPGTDGWGYCVFGEVTAGIEVVDRIRKVPTRRGAGGEESQPVDPPQIATARRVK